jgi:small subunit ribosomal protein S21
MKKGKRVLVQQDNVEKALRKFKKKILESGLLQELRDREFYTKPTTKRKAEKNQAVRRTKKLIKSQELPPKLY